MSDRPLLPLDTRPALFLPELGLHLDAPRKQAFSFVSHAHADHFARHERILCSPETAHLLRRRYQVAADRLHPLAYGEPWLHQDHEIRLLPAGHIFGSAMLHLTRISDGSSLLYTGDFKRRPSLTCQPAQLQPADFLIMETTFGLPRYRFPPRQELTSRLLSFVKDAFAENRTPVVLAYSLGKAQEAHAILSAADLPTVAAKSVCEMSQACHEAGLTLPPPPALADQVPPGHTLIAPPQIRRQKRFAALGPTRTAMLSGWGLDASARYRYRCDAVIPLSDHADYDELIQTVQSVNPQRILTVHGSTRAFARDLRQHGYEAWSLDGNDQLEFPFQTL
ncbi:MBL fold metallo-hydrolase [Roseibacillus ishigakijimensis]|uniref:Zn-dependent metallo-hydrolase RNA specificity domain-containing protein n=1 Tax=Roseibacillus ishigakijimensis TaxID=454146 RepID=A0A934VM72_9BACT|nr:MBL fold metallo-hydrolase [Roseibacillus ishigakijimensis]MBK1833791.1 hypothetical protein [Roseibacillus ishigakijimensis]